MDLVNCRILQEKQPCLQTSPKSWHTHCQIRCPHWLHWSTQPMKSADWWVSANQMHMRPGLHPEPKLLSWHTVKREIVSLKTLTCFFFKASQQYKHFLGNLHKKRNMSKIPHDNGTTIILMRFDMLFHKLNIVAMETNVFKKTFKHVQEFMLCFSVYRLQLCDRRKHTAGVCFQAWPGWVSDAPVVFLFFVCFHAAVCGRIFFSH